VNYHMHTKTPPSKSQAQFFKVIQRQLTYCTGQNLQEGSWLCLNMLTRYWSDKINDTELRMCSNKIQLYLLVNRCRILKRQSNRWSPENQRRQNWSGRYELSIHSLCICVIPLEINKYFASAAMAENCDYWGSDYRVKMDAYWATWNCNFS